MNNILEFKNGYKAAISYDPEIDMFRGDFVGLNGGADFYASDIEGLKHEGAISLEIFLEECKAHNITPTKKESKFALRLEPDLYAHVVAYAKSKNMSINSFIVDSLKKQLADEM